MAVIERRLEDQKQLVEDMMKSKDAELMNRELQTLDKIYDDFVSIASIQRSMSPETGKRLWGNQPGLKEVVGRRTR